MNPEPALPTIPQDEPAVLSAPARTAAEQLRLIADSMPAPIAYYDAESFRCVFATRPYALMLGLDQVSIVGRTFAEIIGAEAAERVRPYVETTLHERRAVVYERRLVRADGSVSWIEVHLVPHLGADSAVIGCFVLVSDVTKERLAEQALRESEDRLAKFMQASAEGILFHKGGYITDANPAVCGLFGYSLEEVIGRHVNDFIAPEQRAKVSAIMSSAIRSEEAVLYESAVVDRQGTAIAVEIAARSLLRNGEHLRMAFVRDIRDRRAAQARIYHLAHHDALTGLPNRTAFLEQMAHHIDAAGRQGGQLAMLFIDLDDFKRVNDSLGHLAGDRLLQTAAARVSATLRATDLVGRFGGDEFMVMLPRAVDRNDAEEVACKLLAAIQSPMEVDGREISISASLGIAMYPADGSTSMELLKHADGAMFLAKARGRGNYQFFDPAHASSAYAALVMESELTDALRRGEFVLHFQPQVHAGTGALVAAEALLRWEHPQRGLLLPDDFIGVAEQQRLILPLSLWVLRQALVCARRWREAGLPTWPIAVNLADMQFRDIGFVDSLEQLLVEHGIDGELLELEISERMLVDDVPEVRRRLLRLKKLGIRLAVDDFGTGYFSPRHLKELPVDKIKIDRAFVRDLPQARDSAAIAGAIIQMAVALGKRVIAEGVENESQRALLAELGCHEIQGDVVSAPLAADRFEAWLSGRPGSLRLRPMPA